MTNPYEHLDDCVICGNPGADWNGVEYCHYDCEPGGWKPSTLRDALVWLP